MSRVIIIFFILLIGGATFKGFVTHTYFVLNQSTIEKTLCVNKDKPELNCHGRCYLKKQLEKDFDEKDENLPNQKKYKLRLISLFVEDQNPLTFTILNTLVRQSFSETKDLYCFLPYLDLLDPPQQIS